MSCDYQQSDNFETAKSMTFFGITNTVSSPPSAPTATYIIVQHAYPRFDHGSLCSSSCFVLDKLFQLLLPKLKVWA